jgi:uncharacterized protein
MTGLLAFAALLVFVGFVGTVLPGLPGVTLIFGGLALAAYADNFQRVGWITLLVLAVLTAMSFGIEILTTMLGAKRLGASKLALVGAALGTLAGFFFGIPGLLLGPFVGAVAGELIAQRKHPRTTIVHASKVGLGAWLGLLVGTIGKLLIAALMIGLFLAVYFSN